MRKTGLVYGTALLCCVHALGAEWGGRGDHEPRDDVLIPALRGPAANHASRPAFQQSTDWSEREYGVGVVRYEAMYTYSARDAVRAQPHVNSDTVAILDGANLCFVTQAECVRSYERMIEYDYEIPGFAILSFNPDSSWARVTLNPYDRKDPPVGWVRLDRDSVSAVLWSDLLPQQYYMFFLKRSEIRFYTRPDTTAPVDLALESHESSSRLDYGMQPLSVDGRFLRVELYSPSPYCVTPEPEVRPDTLWIEYLSEDLRPRIFFYTRGC